MKHIRAAFPSRCAACCREILPGDMVALMRGGDFRQGGYPESWRGHWIHKACLSAARVLLSGGRIEQPGSSSGS